MKTKALLFSALSALTLSAQAHASEANTPYTLVDQGPFHRTWQMKVHLTNLVTGEVQEDVHAYTQLDAGMNYWDTTSGQWQPSQSLIEITPNGAAAVHGQIKVEFSPNLNTLGAITWTTATGQTFQSHPLGLYYFDAASGKSVQIAPVQDCVGVLVPPNIVVYSNAIPGLASVFYMYATNGFDQSLVLLRAPPAPHTVDATLHDATTRLELWTAFDRIPVPQEQRRVILKQQTDPVLRQTMVDPDLVDHILIYPDVWFPVGAAFVMDDSLISAPGQPGQFRLANPSDTNNILVAKTLVQMGDQTVLVEAAQYTDLLPKLRSLPQAALPVDHSNARQEVAQGRKIGPQALSKRFNRPLKLASVKSIPRGLVLDYTAAPASASSFTFTNNATYTVSNSCYLGPGTVTFGTNTCIKFASNAWLLAYGPVSFPSSGWPATFTSVDDNAYGERITNSTSLPNYAAKQAILLYYETSSTTISHVRIRWAQKGIEEDENSGVYVYPTISSASFMNCNIGVYVNVANDTLYLSGVTGCNVVTPISDASGYHSGSMTTDCGVLSVARVNDPTRDTASGDPNKNSQSECSFVVFNTTNIVAAYFNTHLTEYALGYYNWFTGITSPRSASWSVSTNGASSFIDQGPVQPTSPPDTTQGDAGDPAMAIDVSSNVIYLLINPSRDGGWNSTNFTGFRLWTSSNGGQSFNLINTNVGLITGTTGVVRADKPMIAVNNYLASSTLHHLYVAGNSTGHGVFVTHSADGGHTWDPPQILQSNTQVADIAIRSNGAVYVFYQGFALNGNGGQTNWIEYNWLPAGQSTWQGPVTLSAHATSTSLYSTNQYGGGLHLRANGATSGDYFLGNSFPRVAANPVSGRIYVVYSDLPSASATTDQGDIFIQEGIPNSDDSITNWSGEIKVNNDRTTTDQWDPAVTVNPTGTEIFVGYYSRQVDPNNNALIKAYGAKANISNGLIGATFDTFPISSASFTNLFPGTLTSTPSTSPWLFDNVWVQGGVYLDTNAMVVGGPTPYRSAGTYATFTADDYLWTTADSAYFYLAWRDCADLCTNSWNGTAYTRADPNIRLGKLKQ